MDKRLDSLDALRGFDMFFITGGSLLLTALGTLITGNDNSWIAVQMTHATWTEPLRIYDFIFPLFLFLRRILRRSYDLRTVRKHWRGNTLIRKREIVILFPFKPLDLMSSRFSHSLHAKRDRLKTGRLC